MKKKHLTSYDRASVNVHSLSSEFPSVPVCCSGSSWVKAANFLHIGEKVT